MTRHAKRDELGDLWRNLVLCIRGYENTIGFRGHEHFDGFTPFRGSYCLQNVGTITKRHKRFDDIAMTSQSKIVVRCTGQLKYLPILVLCGVLGSSVCCPCNMLATTCRYDRDKTRHKIK